MSGPRGAPTVGDVRSSSLGGSVALAAVLIVSTSASAKPQPISGKLSRSGYTVIAVAAGGEAKSVATRRGRFSVRPPADRVTLHLRARNGTYAGPIVIGRDGRRAIVGVRAGARLGTITVLVRRGYGRVSRRVSKTAMDPTRWGRAEDGAPIGAGNFGRVRARRSGASPPGDRDADAIPNALDIDDDGDLILDDVDRRRATRARASRAALQAPLLSFSAFTNLWLLGSALFADPRTQPINVNAPGVSETDVEAALVSDGRLVLGASGGDSQYVSGELDCRGLVYCSRGGTGLRDASQFDRSPQPFPACCDPDANGLGSLDPDFAGTSELGLQLEPHSPSNQFRAGDVLLVHAQCKSPCGPGGSRQEDLVSTLGSVFATTPALKSYTDELRTEHPVPYPIPAGTTFPLVEDPKDADQDYTVTLTFWRPQRRPVPEELSAGAGEWIDMGGLIHFAKIPGRDVTTFCPATTYSNYEGQGLVATEQQIPSDLGARSVPVFIDSALDHAAAPGNVFSYTLNVSRCLAARGQAFTPGGKAALVFVAQLPLVPGQPINNAQAGYAFSAQS